MPVTVVGPSETVPAFGLIDSGCEHVLVSEGLARMVGFDVRGSQREVPLGIGGRTHRVRFVEGSVRLHPDGGADEEYADWQTEIGVVPQWRPTFQVLLGQVGFLDQFTVTLSRFALEVAVEAIECFDHRFPVSPVTA